MFQTNVFVVCTWSVRLSLHFILLRCVCKRESTEGGVGGARDTVIERAWTPGRELLGEELWECHGEGHGLQRWGQGIYCLHN